MGLDYRTIGTRIMNIRKKCNLSQLQFSELIDKSPTYLSHIESGKKSMSLETFVQIANALYVSADVILAGQLEGADIMPSHEVAMLLADCSDFESLVITDTLKSIKTALRKHQTI